MPFKSEAQRRWMYANDPKMAKEWESHTPPGKLPQHVSDQAGDRVRRLKKKEKK